MAQRASKSKSLSSKHFGIEFYVYGMNVLRLIDLNVSILLEGLPVNVVRAQHLRDIHLYDQNIYINMLSLSSYRKSRGIAETHSIPTRKRTK